MALSADPIPALYEKAVPRYTSYPTAPHFQQALTSADSKALLKAQAPNARYSLYLHIPFCKKLCSYCGCFTRIVNHQAPVKSYVEALVNEIKLAGKALETKPQVSHIHFGGGSPNLLDSQDLAEIFAAIGEHFTILETAERAMEMDPRILNEQKIRDFAAAGVNRISLGVQDFQEDVQKAVNRIQPYDRVARSVAWMREAGIKGINFDLMYGLPKQTIAGIEDNIAKTAALAPDRIALFGYAHVPWMRAHQKQLEVFHLPTSAERLEQNEAARSALAHYGYRAVGMDHFAKESDPLFTAYQDGTLKRNFQGYTTDDADILLGFGLSAISRFPQAYTQNTTSIKSYKTDIAAGSLPVMKGCFRTDEDRLRHDIIESLMCYFHADTEAICQKHGLSPALLREDLASLADLEEQGIVTCAGGTVRITRKGQRLVRVVCARFDTYFTERENRHAKAV